MIYEIKICEQFKTIIYSLYVSSLAKHVTVALLQTLDNKKIVSVDLGFKRFRNNIDHNVIG